LPKTPGSHGAVEIYERLDLQARQKQPTVTLDDI